MSRSYHRHLRTITPSRLVTIEPDPDRGWLVVLGIGCLGAALVIALLTIF